MIFAISCCQTPIVEHPTAAAADQAPLAPTSKRDASAAPGAGSSKSQRSKIADDDAGNLAAGACPDRPSARSLRGDATYYSNRFSGRKTASGERYNPKAFTAAHRSLPFGTMVRVRRRDHDGPAICVRITDRGPFGNARRVIDLSYAAATRLEMLRAGVVPVVVDVLAPEAAAR